MIEINEFRRNQSRVPASELAKFNGQYVAWSPDGTQIVAGHSDPLQLDELIRIAGYQPEDLLVSFMAYPEEVAWCGWSVPEVDHQP